MTGAVRGAVRGAVTVSARGFGVFFFLCAVLIGCSGGADKPSADVLLSELEAAETVWESGDRSDYSYIYLRSCNCERPEPQGPNTVFVVDGVVASIEHFGSRESLDGFTAEDLFGQLRQAIDDGKEILATYDSVTGLPTSLNLDLNAEPEADPLILDIHSFLSYADARSALTAARAQWDGAGLDDYEFSFETNDTGVVEVEVSDGKVITDGLGTATDGRQTMTDLFDEIEAAIEERPDVLTVSYHPTLGHPTSYLINVDLSQRGKIDVRSISVTS